MFWLYTLGAIAIVLTWAAWYDRRKGISGVEVPPRYARELAEAQRTATQEVVAYATAAIQHR